MLLSSRTVLEHHRSFAPCNMYMYSITWTHPNNIIIIHCTHLYMYVHNDILHVCVQRAKLVFTLHPLPMRCTSTLSPTVECPSPAVAMDTPSAPTRTRSTCTGEGMMKMAPSQRLTATTLVSPKEVNYHLLHHNILEGGGLHCWARDLHGATLLYLITFCEVVYTSQHISPPADIVYWWPSKH